MPVAHGFSSLSHMDMVVGEDFTMLKVFILFVIKIYLFITRLSLKQ